MYPSNPGHTLPIWTMRKTLLRTQHYATFYKNVQNGGWPKYF